MVSKNHFSLLSIFLFITLYNTSHGKQFSKCELARELSSQGIPTSELPDWVCLTFYESNYQTTATNTNTNGSKDWGIFQINDRFWCKPDDGRRTSNECNIDCNSLLSDDITASVTCAKKIKKQQGFKAWNGWKSHCQTNKPSVDECF